MEETTTRSIQLTLAFADATTRNIRFNGVDEDAMALVKNKVKALNANMPPEFAATFVSAIGAQCVMINKAQAIITTEEVIYRAS